MLTSPWVTAPAKTYDWVQYLILGLGFPALLIGWHLLPGGVGASWTQVPRGALVLLGLSAGGWLIVREGQLVPLVAAFAQVALMWRLLLGADGGVRPARAAAVFVVSTIAWSMAVRLLWWTTLGDELRTGFPASFVALVLALLLICTYVAGSAGVEAVRGRFRLPAVKGVRWAGRGGVGWFSRGADAVALLLIGLVAFRTDGLFEVLDERGAVHHWSLFVGSAELVRQGGWLYWDVPSPYGFLSILTLALFPSGSAWQALYVLQSILLCVTGAFLFLVLRASRSGFVGWCAALVITFAALFFVSAWEESQLASSYHFPSTGPYRFFWCYALLAVLIWEVRTRERSLAQGQRLVVGCLVWLVGVLWAPESAVYCSVVWLPAYAFLVGRRTLVPVANGRRPRLAVGRASAWLALPPLLLLVSVGAVIVYYLLRLGHAPDPVAYLDYLLAFGEGFAGRPVDRSGAVLALVLGLCLVATAGAYAVRDGLPRRALGLIAGIWGAVWASSSYFVGVADPNNALRVFAFVFVALGLLFWLLARRPEAGDWGGLVRFAAVPLMTVVLVIFFTNPPSVAVYVDAQRSFLNGGGDIERRLPDVDASLAALMVEAGVRPNDPIVYGGSDLANLLPTWKTEGRRVAVTEGWLPTLPVALFTALSEERKSVYLDRFVERARLGGWLIQRKEGGLLADSRYGAGYDLGPWLFDQLRRTHAATRGFENANWSLVWFEYVGEGEAAVRDMVSPGMYRLAPPDILVDGRRQVMGAGLWATFGLGWFPGSVEDGARWASSPARLDIYSPDARRVDLRALALAAKPDPISGSSTLRVAVNGGVPTAVPIQAGEPLRVSVDLNRGMNEVTLELAEGNFRLSDFDPENTDPRPYSFHLNSIDIVGGGDGGPSALAPGPEFVASVDILVDGRPQVAGEGLWARHGAGWYPAATPDGDRWASSPAWLDVYSQSARRVGMTMTPVAIKPAPGNGRSTLRVAANGGEAATADVAPGQAVRFGVELRAGWNRVMFELEEGNFRSGDYDPSNTDPRLYSFQVGAIDIVSE